MSLVNLKDDVLFEKSIIINTSAGIQDNNGQSGQLRFNYSKLKFEGYHSTLGADIFGNIWRPLTQDVASTSNLGVIRIGNNLVINPTTGLLSSVASGSGRIKQLVITVSPILNAADFQTINDAISNAIGTPAGGYIDGSITSIIGSPPSTTYPFLIQLAPGQYSETLNQIILPDYVSLIGEGNYNSVITQNAGNNDIATGSMIVLGQNCTINNLVIKLADSASSQVSNALYALNKSNIEIDNCIFTCNNNINTTTNTYYIYIDGGSTNSITNCQFLGNTSTLTGNFNIINIVNSSARIINNKIDILSQSTTNTIGINIDSWNQSESIIDKTYIENLTLSINYYKTIINGFVNIGISLNNSPVILKNSSIEVSTDQAISTNYGLQFNSSTPLIQTTSTNILSFVNSPNSVYNIVSNNTGTVNFTTLGFQRGQYISVSGSQFNDGIYKIYTVLSSSSILLDRGFQVINESANSIPITLTALYDVEISNSKINTLGNYSIYNNDSNSNYSFNLNNLINESSLYITPSSVFYTNYKTISVGKVNCDFNSLRIALNSISDNSSNNRYFIKVESGIYQEQDTCFCKDYVNIEGNGSDNTTILFNQASNTSGTPYSNTSCFILGSNMTISNMTIKNENILYTPGQTTSTILYTNNNSIINFTLENIVIDSINNSVYNTGIYLNNTNLLTTDYHLTFRNVNININSQNTASLNIGIYANTCRNLNCYNLSIETQSTFSTNNYAISLDDSLVNIYDSILYSNSGSIENIAINTTTNNLFQKLVNIYNSKIRVSDAVDYSINADNYYTVICNNCELLGDTNTNTTESRIFCSGCYAFNDSNDLINAQTLNSRGQNEQTLGTITIGDSAGKLNSTGTDNVIVGVNAGSNVTTASYSTIIGSNAGKSITSANNNTLLGSNTGESITTGSYNTITGSNAGININIGNKNVINGYNIANSLTTGSQNILIGNETAATLTTGNLNVYIGHSAGSHSITSNTNTFIGAFAGNSDQSGNDNTYIGYQSGNSSIIANDNIMIGNQSGYTNQSNSIVSIGKSAGYNNTNSIKNTYLGTNSGYNNTTGDGNTYLGINSGYSTTSASGGFNTAIGNEAGYSLTTGSRNVLVGSTTSSNGTSNDSAGWSLSSGTDNVHIGVSAGNNATSTINNVLIGSSVGTAITTAGNNVLIGKNTGNTLDTTGQNVIIGTNAGSSTNLKTGYNAGNAVMIGYNAGAGYTGTNAFAIGYQAGANISGDYNMFMGYNSGGLPKLNTTGSYNIAIGPYTGFNLTSGARNIIIGSGDSISSAGKQISTGSDNTLLGYKSGSALSSGNGNTLFGSNAGANLTSGQDNLILGYQSAFNLNSGSYNVVLGPQAGYNLNGSTAQGNIYAGYQSGYNNISGGYNINVGYQSGYESTDGEYNIHLGHKAGYSSTANKNIILGYQAGQNNTIGTNNIFIGLEAGAGVNSNSEQIGDNNIFVGNQAGYSNDNGYRNIFMGYNAGLNNEDGSKNIFIGENTGSLSSTSHNIFIGTSSTDLAGVGYQSTTTGEYNVFIGHDVGIENTTGKDNIFLGDGSGQNNVEGLENIYIGKHAGQNANSITANYNIAIGSDAGINNESGKENILIGRQVAGLVTSTNYNQNIIIGTDAGQNIQQDNQIFIGTNAGKLNTTGNRNIFIGLNTGQSNINSPDNVIIGSDAGISLIGNGGLGDNVIIGSQAGHDLTTGVNNIYIGSSTGSSAVTSINNVVIGSNAMSNGDCSNVIIIGYNAGKNNNTNNNIFVGPNSGYTNTSGTKNIAIGVDTLKTNIIGIDNIAIGYQSGYNNLKDDNIFIGNLSGYSNTTGKENTFIGSFSGQNNTIGNYNLIFGKNAGLNNTIGNDNIIMGVLSGVSNTSGSNNVFIGSNSGYNNTIGSNNLCIGQSSSCGINGNLNINFGTNSGIYMSGYNVNNICIGYNTGVYLTNTAENIFIGTSSGQKNTSGFDNVFIGYLAGYNNTVGYYNIFIGYAAGYNCIDTQFHICIGNRAGYSLNTGSYSNLFMGYNAGQLTTSGQSNIFLGTDAGSFNSTGSQNICIGRASGYYSTTCSNNIFIGDATGTLNITGNKNTFIGASAGFTSNGSNNTYIGCFTGQANNGSNNFFLGYETNKNVSQTITSTYSNKFAIYQSSNIGITSNTTAGVCNLLLGGDFSTGTLGIGTIVPDSFALGGMGSYTSTKLVVLGKVLANAYTTFTGTHKINIDSSIIPSNILEGMIMSSTGNVRYEDINNTVVTVIPSSKINDKGVYGVYSGNETIIDSNSKISTTLYYVNSLGEGGILVSNYGGDIQNGDYITTCPITGYGSLQSDDIMHSYTVAKCTQNIDWSLIPYNITYDENQYKTTIVSCTYHCG